jgi:tetratricopeptide (TPR) repeat protein
MLRHIALITFLTLAALAAGLAMVPGEREQWTMLVRDGRNREALKALEARYYAGKRESDAVFHLYKLYMSFAEIDAATRIVRRFVDDHPNDPAALALLAKHYDDIEDKAAEASTLERLFAIAPSQQTARDLLAYYRLEGAFDREEKLLRKLLETATITANDAERLGLILAAHGDLFGARDALTRFDEIANPERSIGRIALFDVLVQIGDKSTALTKAASWIGYWRKVSMHRAGGAEAPYVRLIRMMMAVDEAAARRLICAVQRGEAANADDSAASGGCEITMPDAEADPPGNAVTSIEPRDEAGRRKRR